MDISNLMRMYGARATVFSLSVLVSIPVSCSQCPRSIFVGKNVDPLLAQGVTDAVSPAVAQLHSIWKAVARTKRRPRKTMFTLFAATVPCPLPTVKWLAVILIRLLYLFLSSHSQNPSMECNAIGTISLVSSFVFHRLLLTIEYKPTSLPCITALLLPGCGPAFQSCHWLHPVLQHTTHTSKHDPTLLCPRTLTSMDASTGHYPLASGWIWPREALDGRAKRSMDPLPHFLSCQAGGHQWLLVHSKVHSIYQVALTCSSRIARCRECL